MAEGKEKHVSLETDVTTTCPICFESSNTPRILPCLHTFCHYCLSSYILSTCKAKVSPVGFPCPLCRRFVPAPSFSIELEKWSELIPINKAIQVLIEKGDKLCDACQREDEDSVASDWCESCSESLCAMCAKAHKRSAASRNHTLVPIADFCKVPGGKERMESASVFCLEHSKRVKYLCVDHKELCCTKCVCTKHRTCTQVDDIEEAAKSLRKSEKIKTLSEEISQFEGSLVKAKSDGEDTIKYIEDTSDQIKEESTVLRDKIVNHVNTLLKDHLSELAQNAKEHKGSVVSFVDAVSDRQLLMAQYLHTLENTDKTPASVLVNDYLKIKKQFDHVTKSGLSQIRVQLQSRTCTQVDDIEEAAENLRKSEKIKKSSKEISQFEGSFAKAKSNGEDTIKYIDDTSDQIKEESTELRDKIVNHVNALLENHLSELAQNAKKQKERLASFVDAASDRQFLMAQYLHTLEFSEETPASVLVQDYYMIKRQFEHVTQSGFSQIKLKLQSNVPKDLTGILKVTKFTDLKTEMKYVPLRGIDFTNAEMKFVYELSDSSGDVTGGCFLENGDIILVDHRSNQLLHYSNAALTHTTKYDIQLQDAVCQNTSRLLISKNVLTKKRKSLGFIGTFNLNQFEDNKFYIAKENRFVYGLAISEEFVYAACSEVVIKFDHKGRTVQQYPVDKNTFSVATNNNNEIISSSCDTHKVTVMSSSGEKMYKYSSGYYMYMYTNHALRYPRGLDVNFTGNIFVAGKDSCNIHVLTPKAELLKIFAIDSRSPPTSIKLKENSNVCFVGSCEATAKVYEFQEDTM